MKMNSLVAPKDGRKRKVDKRTQKVGLVKENREKQSRWAGWLEWVNNR